MSNVIYRQFYREHGARYPDALTRPADFKLDKFPRECVFHVYDDGDGVPTVDSSKPYYSGYSRRILLEHVYHYHAPVGMIRPAAFNFTAQVQPWKISHTKNWQLEDDLSLVKMAPDQLAVVNYGFLDVAYKYQAALNTEYCKWFNRTSLVYEKMGDLAEKTGRQQFIIVKVPTVLQGRTVLDKFADSDFVSAMNTILGQPDSRGYLLLDFWRWIGVSHRNRSLLNGIPKKHYDKINFIFEGVNGKQILVNLGYMNSWIKGQDNTTEFSNVVQFSEINVQKLFLKLCLTLNEVAVVEAEEETPDVGVQQVTVPPDAETDDTEVDVKNEAIVPNQSVAQPTKTSMPDFKKGDEVKLVRQKVGQELLDSIEADLEALDKISLVQAKNKGVAKDLPMTGKKLSEEVKPEIAGSVIPEPVLSKEEALSKIFAAEPPASTLMKRLAEDAESSLITAAEYRRMAESVKAFDVSEDPYGSGKPRKEASMIKPEDLALTPEDNAIVVGKSVPDKTMAESSLNQFNRKYLKNVYKKDVMNMIGKLQSTGVVVKAHEVSRTSSILGEYEHHRLELKPVDGQPSTIKFSLPVVSEDGSFTVAGNKYLARKARRDVVIRKIAPTIVGLSTYYGKTFVQVSPKVVNNSLAWLIRSINTAIVTEGSFITDISLGNVFNNEFKAPFIYNALSSEFESFTAGKDQFFFDHRTRKTKIDEKTLLTIEKDGRVFCGLSANKRPIVVDRSNHFYEVNGGNDTALGDIYQVLRLNKENAPTDFSEVRVFSKYVPVGVVLGYYIGFKALVAALGAEYRIIEPRKNKMLTENEYAIVFKDKTYAFNRNQTFASLILAGFGDFDKVTKLYDSAMFENKDVYLNLLMSKGFGALYVRELDMMEHAFVDPISEECLIAMKEPTTFKGLLYRATELLLTYHHPVSQDRSVMRDCGYERFAGAAYKELTLAVRQFRNKNLIGRSKIDISPFQVWNSVMKDSSIKIVEDINPIQNMKEAEIVTFSGAGGRDKETMTKPSRAYHESSVGVDSESTVDNAGVGTVLYLSANPNIADVRGASPEHKKLNATSMMSTAALSSPCSFNDNPKRIMFINTQHSHTIAAEAYRQPYVRTGYEKVISKRTTKLFSTAAEQDGFVSQVSDKGMVVKYADGSEDSIPLGRQYGKAEGTVYPHDLETKFSLGQKFKKGAILAFNSKFFEPDFIEPGEVNMKICGFVTVAFMEDKSTHEDSCTISPKLGQQFKTEVTKIKSYVVRFEQGLQDVRKIGDEVLPRDVLMVIDDGVTGSIGNFSDDSINTLKRLANVAPRAGIAGKIEKIEIYYHGDKRDMSPTLKKLCDKSDSDIAANLKATGKPVVTGEVTSEYRVSGTPLELDQAEIKFYITTRAPTGVGDKAIFGHQMKSTIAEVHPGEIFTEDGVEIDAVFSYRSLANREVNSTNLVGTTTVLLDLAAKRALKAYYGESK